MVKAVMVIQYFFTSDLYFRDSRSTEYILLYDSEHGIQMD